MFQQCSSKWPNVDFFGGIFVLKLFKDLSEPEGDPLLSSWTGKSETRGALVLKEGPCGPVCTVAPITRFMKDRITWSDYCVAAY